MSGVCPKTWTWREWSSKPSPAAPTESPPISCKNKSEKSSRGSLLRVLCVVFFSKRHLPNDIMLPGKKKRKLAPPSGRVFVFLDSCLLSSHSYFRKGCYFGLACFANMAVESTVERGARMKSVGILSPSYTLLYRYMSFLEHQVR